MGQITIEVPQKVNRNYRIVDHEVADEIINRLEKTVPQPDSVCERSL